MGRPAQDAPPRPRRRSWLVWFLGAIGVIVLLMVILVGLWWFVGRPILTGRLVDRFAPVLADNLDFSWLQGQAFSFNVRADDLNEGLVEALPADLGPVEDVRVELLPDSLRLYVRALGGEHTLEADVLASQGDLQILRVRVGGLLNWLVEPRIIAAEVERVVNEELRENDIRLEELRLSPQGITIRIAPR